jgi:predicted MFS family arabinose efflux permease
MKSPLLRNRDFLRLWAGQGISQFGSIISREAVPFAAALTLGASPLQMGILSGAGAAVLVVGLFAGAWVDRVHRRPVLIGADLARFVLLASIPFAAAIHRLTLLQLYIVQAAAAIFTLLFDSAHQAYVPDLLTSDQLVDANSKLALTQSLAEVSGPGITGVLVQWITAPRAILLDALSYIVSAISLASIGFREPRFQPVPQRRIASEIAEGLRFSWGNPILRSLLTFAAVGAFFLGFYGSLYILYTVRELRLSTAVIGVIISAGGAANFVGALSAERLVKRFGLGRALTGSALTIGIATLLPPFASGSIRTAAAVLILAQLFDAAWPVLNVCETSLRQMIAPENLRGRVNSAIHLMFRGCLPLGSLAGGALAEIVGIRATLFLSGTGFLLSSIWLFFSPIRRWDYGR